jgi:hypothetical protein
LTVAIFNDGIKGDSCNRGHKDTRDTTLYIETRRGYTPKGDIGKNTIAPFATVRQIYQEEEKQ